MFLVFTKREIHESARISDESHSVARTLTRLSDVFVAFASVRRNARLALPALAERRDTTQGTSTTERRTLA